MQQLSELQTQAANVQKDIATLKSKLHELYEKKEDWYSKKDGIRSTVIELIQEVKKIKSQLDSSREVKEGIRKQRDEYNAHSKELIDRFKKLIKEKRDAHAKNGLRVNPEGLNQQIAKMETRIETEALSFKEEKKVMTRVNELKKKLKEASLLHDAEHQLDVLSREITASKKKGDEEHKKLIDFIATEKDNYTKFIELSKKINELKRLQQEAFDNFKALKEEFLGTDNILQEKLHENSKIFGTFRQEKAKIATEKRQKVLQTLEQKTRAVEEKLKKKKKLTTEDLLVFQGKI